ncbi:MAG: dynamin family protein [Brevibacterium sp.]|uniref:dynamin family protein n=1 Tax=Brevibacterium sp. TaxID=1701 RepID=UPI002648DD9A|nr:dynamin family protein [Brevibacterium sp.]MDN5832826.1 dynamin family protein [Brevibacterium sp.]MDN5875339.1 dynamin family protein [Brevibacterium sp.]MDN5908057.1 dynamin family protein [Brevibacterium sp.]MDN6122768.1 dynamin family protein [Brevibacterium sp.]MDN6133649.1 dynamin family protein [Brevibacterium sp.]
MTDSKRAVTPPVGGALSDIAKRVSETRFTLQTEDFADGRELHRQLSSELTDYLLPRINRTQTPFMIAVGGSTGAGKSTLVNSLVGRPVSPAGVRRPTTGNPIVVHNPADAKFFESQSFLSDLPRSTDPATSTPSVVLIADDGVEPGTAVLDCPDIDSIAESNRELARRILMSADLWMFVTTANRYADAAPWALLKDAAVRHTSVAIVLDRVPPEANREVRHHLSSLLSESGLGNSPIFAVAELELEDGLLPHSAIYPIRSWISQVSTEGRSQERIRQRTLTGSIGALPAQVNSLADFAESQESTFDRLQASLDQTFSAADAGLAEVFSDGRVLQGEVNAKWQDFVGTGQLFRGLEPTMARMRDRISATVTGKHDAASPLHIAILRSAAISLREQAIGVVDEIDAQWLRDPAGSALLDAHPELRYGAEDLEDSVKSAVSGWSNEVNALVRDIGQGKKSKARILSFGVGGVCAVVEYAAFWDPKYTDADGHVSRNDANVALSLAGTIFGEQEAVNLIGSIRDRFLSTATGIVGGCRTPFDNVLRLSAVPARQSGALRASGDRLEVAL